MNVFVRKCLKISALFVLVTLLFKSVRFTKTTKRRLFVRQTDLEILGLSRTHYSNNVNIEDRGLTVDWWFDTCFLRTTWQRTWHPLFPWHPQKTTKTLISGEKIRNMGNSLRRIHGYLFTEHSGFYEFKLYSRDGAEFILLDTDVQLRDKAILSLPILENSNEVLRMNLTKSEMDEQDAKLNLTQLFSSDVCKVWLEANRLYFMEIVQGGKHFAKYQLHWRNASESDSVFTMLDQNNLLYSNETASYSRINKPIGRYPLTEEEIQRNSFNFIEVLNGKTPSIYDCESPTDLEPITIENRYDGWVHLQQSLTYPNELLNASHQLLERDEALNVSQKYFETINSIYNNTLQHESTVYVHKNVNNQTNNQSEWEKMYYFVEVDVKMNDANDDNTGVERRHRVSHYVRLGPDGICFIPEYQWKDNVEINLITPIRNQKVWLLYLIRMLKDIMEETNEENVKLILVDVNSTDGNYAEIMSSSRLRHQYLYLKADSFNKVKALNHGLEHVTNNNSIAFILDLQLQLPLNMFDRIRKLTIQNRIALAPILMHLGCGEHEMYTEIKSSMWLHHGVGLISMYKSDWLTVNGFNEKLFGNTWGGEDTELIDRVLQKGLKVIRCRLSRFYHIYHSRKGAWYNN